jgi:hypothetical protein
MVSMFCGRQRIDVCGCISDRTEVHFFEFSIHDTSKEADSPDQVML